MTFLNCVIVGILYFVVFAVYSYFRTKWFVEKLDSLVKPVLMRAEEALNTNKTILEVADNTIAAANVSTNSASTSISTVNILLTIGGTIIIVAAGYYLVNAAVAYLYPQPIYLPYDSWLAFHLKANSAYGIYVKWLPIYTWKAQSLKYYLEYYTNIWVTHDNPAAYDLPEVIITLGQRYQQMLDFQHCGFKVLQYVCASDPGSVKVLSPKDLDLFFKTLEHSREITDFILLSKKVADADAFGVINKLFI